METLFSFIWVVPVCIFIGVTGFAFYALLTSPFWLGFDWIQKKLKIKENSWGKLVLIILGVPVLIYSFSIYIRIIVSIAKYFGA